MRQPPISPQLLDKYLRNQCTREEKELVEAWYTSLEKQPDYLDSLPEEEQRQLQDETFLSIQEQIHADEKPLVRKLPLRWLTGLAASVVLAIGLYLVYQHRIDQMPALTKQVSQPAPEKMVEFVNKQAHLVRHFLPDSSMVWLHPGASVRYTNPFAANKRLVAFSGEGFFDVKKDKSRPFYVQSGAVQIKVLGTSFNVKAPGTQTAFQVSVVTGRVEVSALNKQNRTQQVVLQPQQQANFEPQSGQLTASVTPSQAKKELYEPVTITFDNTPVAQVLNQLQKRFNVQIKLVNPKMASCLVSADFEQQPLPDIMEMLCTALEATYTVSGSKFTLDGLPCE
jgi:transmembrane sensor